MSDENKDAKNGPLDQTTGTGENSNTGGESNKGAGAGSATTTDKKEKGKNTVEVEKDVLERILKTIESQGEKIKILTEVADKNRLTRVEELRSQGKLVKKVFLNTFDGKIIIGWKKIKDDVYTDQEGRLHEDQVVGLIFHKEKEVGKEMDIRSFSRLIVKVPVEVVEEGKDKEGNINFTVQTEDGQEIKIDSRFIN